MGKHDKNTQNKHICIISMLRWTFIILMIISALYIIQWYMENKQNKELKENIAKAIVVTEITEKPETTELQYNIDFEQLKKINEDTIGWLKVNGTDIEYTVVKTRDNSYYLNHNFEKKYNKAGWIFADYKNKMDGADKNIVIYGHNRKDNSMFGTLKNIVKEEWYNNEDNYIINFITEKEVQKYEVFSVYQIKTEDYYIKTDFTQTEFDSFIDKIKNRSIKNFNIEINSEDTILTLSTCANNYRDRIVLHAKKLINNVEKIRIKK